MPGSRKFHTRQNQARGTGRQGMAPRMTELCSTRTSGNLAFGSCDIMHSHVISNKKNSLTSKNGSKILYLCRTSRSTGCNNNFRFGKRYPRTSDKGGGTTLVRLCLARVFLVRCCASARLQLHLQQPNARRQIAPHLLSGGQQTVDSAGATLDFLVQHLISRNLSRKRPHLFKKHFSCD